MAESRELQEAGMKAVAAFVARPLVFIANEEHGVGSGVLLRTPGGHSFVLTARHNFEKDQVLQRPPDVRYRLGYQHCRDALPRPFADVELEPDGRDVAIGILTPEAHEQLKDRALDLSVVWKGPGQNVPYWHVIAGFPGGLSLRTEDAMLRGSITYVTTAEGPTAGGVYSASWDQAVPDDTAAAFGMEPSKQFTLFSPHGVSGGALWRIRPFRRAVDSALGRQLSRDSVLVGRGQQDHARGGRGVLARLGAKSCGRVGPNLK